MAKTVNTVSGNKAIKVRALFENGPFVIRFRTTRNGFSATTRGRPRIRICENTEGKGYSAWIGSKCVESARTPEQAYRKVVKAAWL